MRTKTRSLGDVLFGRIRGGILALLYGHPGESFYVRQIARTLDASVGAVQRELELLTSVGILQRSRRGNQVFYQADRNSPIFAELQAAVRKTVGILQQLRSALEPLTNKIRAAFVYGSTARNEDTAHSDVDLMIVGSVTLDSVIDHLGKLGALLARPVNPMVYSVSEYRSKLAAGNHFLKSVVRGKKVFLFGDENELRKVGGIRVAEARSHQSG